MSALDAPAARAMRARDGLCVLAVALVVRALVLADALDAPFWSVPLVDETAYLDLARMLADGAAPAQGAWYVAPGYAYVLCAFDMLGVGPLAVKLVQLLSGAASAWLVWRLASDVCGRAAAIAAGVAWAIVPSALLQELLLLKTTFATTAALAALVLMRARSRSRPPSRHAAIGRGVAAGALWGVATLLRGEFAILSAAVCAAAVAARWRRWPAAPPLGASLAAAAMVAVAIAIPTLQNQRWGGGFVPLAFGGGVNFYIGNHAGADGSYLPLRPDRSDPPQEEADAVALASRGLGRTARPADVSRYWMRQALDWWRREPGAALELTLRKWAIAWGPWELADTLSTAQAGRWVAALRQPLVTPALLLPLAVVGLWLARRRRALWPLFAFVAGAQLAIVPFFLFERFRLHLVAACTPFAALAVEQAISAARARRWRPLAAGTAAVVAFAAVTAGVRVARDETVLRVNVGELLFLAGKPAEALREFEAVRAASPGAFRVDLNVANAEAALGHDDAALAALERVLIGLRAEGARTGQPAADELMQCHERAGDLELRRGRAAAAAAHYTAALEFATGGAAATLRAKRAALP